MPTLVGSRDLLARLGIVIGDNGNGSCAEVYVAQGSHLLGKIQISDSVRQSAAPAVRSLRDMNLRVVLMTGDSVPIARAVADELGVDDFVAGLLPDDKLARVRRIYS